MANSPCRTWSGCSARAPRASARARWRASLVVALCFAFAWLSTVPAEAAPRRGKKSTAAQQRQKQRRAKARAKRRAPAAESSSAEPGDDLPTNTPKGEAAEAPPRDEPEPAEGERETIDLGAADGEKETIDLGDGGGDRETIELGESSSPGATAGAAPATVEEEQNDFQLRGWGRSRVTQAVYIQPLASDGLGVPQEGTLAEQQLFVEVRYARNRWFEAAASGLFTYTLARHEEQNGPTTVEASRRGLFEPSLRELYVGLYSTHVSGRAGQQRVAWGNSDAFAINDIVNPWDLREPILAETDVLHVPSPLVRLDVTGSWGAVQLLVAPFFRPNLFDIYGTNWALVQPDAPQALRGALGRLSDLTDPSLREPTQLLLRQTSLPPDDFTATSAGARLDWSAAGLNVSHYYFYGYTSAPALRIDPALLASLASVDWNEPSTDLAPLLGAVDSGALSSTYERTHHVGSSLQTGLGSFVLRAEGAYDSTRILLSRQLLAVLRPAVQAVVGVEYQPGEDGKAIILEGMFQRVLGADPGPLLGAEQTSYGVASVLRWTFLEHLELELRAVASLAPLGATLRPQVAYKKSFWEVRLGYVWIDGVDGSQQHYYRRNQSGYALGKLKF
jgi:hypothetical protein